MSRILPNKLLYLFCWFTAAMVLCLYSTGLKAAIITPLTTTITQNIRESISNNLTAKPVSVVNFPSKIESSAIIGDHSNRTHNLLNAGNLVAEKQITCYPNPANSYINFKFKKPVKSDCKILIYSFTGRKMDELSITGTIMKLNLDDYYRGLYVYQLRDERGAVLESGKFQVKK